MNEMSAKRNNMDSMNNTKWVWNIQLIRLTDYKLRPRGDMRMANL